MMSLHTLPAELPEHINHEGNCTGLGDTPPARRRMFVGCCGAAALVLYVATCAPGLLWQDSAMFQWRVHVGEYSGGTLGLALGHPLYIFLARLFALLPWNDHAYGVNLFSAVCAAAAIAVFADLMVLLTGRIGCAAGAVTVLAVSHTFWKHAVIAEVMSLYSLGLVIELWILVHCFHERRPRWLMFAMLVNGLNVSNHLLALLHAPAYAGVLIHSMRNKRLTMRQCALVAGCFVIGCAPYWILCLSHVTAGRPFGEVLHSALYGEVFAKDVLNTAVSPVRQSLRTLQYFVLNFPTPLLLAAPLGLAACLTTVRFRGFAWAAGMIFVTDFVFAFRYPVADQYVFFLPCYVLTAAYVGVGLMQLRWEGAAQRAGLVAAALLPILAYEFGPELLRTYRISIPGRQDVPFRDAYTYFLRPRMNGETSARRFAESALHEAAPDGLLIADFSVNSPIIYVRDIDAREMGVSLVRPSDIPPRAPWVMLEPESVKPFVERGIAWTTTNSVVYLPAWIGEEYDFVRDGVLYRLVKKPQGTIKSVGVQ